MKLLLFLLLIPLVCKSQTDTSYKWWKDSMLSGSTIDTTPTLYIINIPNPTYDTTSVIMLCSDTAKLKTKGYWSVFQMKDGATLTVDGVPRGYAPLCFWIFGYAVTRREGYFYAGTEYLGIKKNPLIKKIVVWMALPTEKMKGF